MDWSAAVAVAGTLLGLLVSAAIQLFMARRQRREHLHDLAAAERRHQRAQRAEAYAQFMAAASDYGNRMHEHWEARRDQRSDVEVSVRRQAQYDAHQAFMAPLWRLRMQGSAEAVARGEAVLANLYSMRATYVGDSVDYDGVQQRWEQVRDDFLDVSRRELGDEAATLAAASGYGDRT